jgi:hypothetical protein
MIARGQIPAGPPANSTTIKEIPNYMIVDERAGNPQNLKLVSDSSEWLLQFARTSQKSPFDIQETSGALGCPLYFSKTFKSWFRQLDRNF